MVDKINLNISSNKEEAAEYMSVVRLTTSAVTSKVGFDIEEIDDVKVAIGEACNNIIKHGLVEGKGCFNIEYSIYEDKLIISVKDEGCGFDTSEIKEPRIDGNVDKIDESGLGIFIIKSLMDEVVINSDEEHGTEIIMTKIKIA